MEAGAINITGALVFPDVIDGITDASITLNFDILLNLHSESNTVIGSFAFPLTSTSPIAHVPTG